MVGVDGSGRRCYHRGSVFRARRIFDPCIFPGCGGRVFRLRIHRRTSFSSCVCYSLNALAFLLSVMAFAQSLGVPGPFPGHARATYGTRLLAIIARAESKSRDSCSKFARPIPAPTASATIPADLALPVVAVLAAARPPGSEDA